MHNVEELERALEYPWEKWTVFLHIQNSSDVNCRRKSRTAFG